MLMNHIMLLVAIIMLSMHNTLLLSIVEATESLCTLACSVAQSVLPVIVDEVTDEQFQYDVMDTFVCCHQFCSSHCSCVRSVFTSPGISNSTEFLDVTLPLYIVLRTSVHIPYVTQHFSGTLHLH